MRLIKTNFLIVSFILTQVTQLFAQEITNPKNQSEELGNVHWYRNYDEAIALAKKEKKDIVILFQEVPGCATCRNYGHNVLSHPLMVEALENSFIPLAIFNNKNGEDKKILEKFNEPSWNNPVVRIINSDGNNVVQRINSDYSALTLSKRLKESLIKRKSPVPLYLDLLEQELTAHATGNINEVNLKMYCFWTGEKQLGKLDGVLDVEAGFIGHNEVVKVTYNNALVKESEIVSYAQENNFEFIKSSPSYRVAPNDVHYYLLHSDYKYLPLSELQKIKINSALGSNQSPTKYLSPNQTKWLDFLKNNKQKVPQSLINQKIEDTWEVMQVSYTK